MDDSLEVTVENIQKVFHYANTEYFGAKLPYAQILWSDEEELGEGNSGSCFFDVEKSHFVIVLHVLFKKMVSHALMTMYHEMVHIEQWNDVEEDEWHGDLFNERMAILAAEGLFDGNW